MPFKFVKLLLVLSLWVYVSFADKGKGKGKGDGKGGKGKGKGKGKGDDCVAVKNGLSIHVDNGRDTRFCEIIYYYLHGCDTQLWIYSNIPYGPCDQAVFDDVSANISPSEYFVVASRFNTRDITVFRTGVDYLDMKTFTGLNDPNNTLSFLYIGFSQLQSVTEFVEFEILMDVTYVYKKDSLVFFLEFEGKKQYILASSNGQCDMTCLYNTLEDTIVLPSNDWTLIITYAKEDITLNTEGSAIFVKDNLDNNFLFLKEK